MTNRTAHIRTAIIAVALTLVGVFSVNKLAADDEPRCKRVGSTFVCKNP